MAVALAVLIGCLGVLLVLLLLVCVILIVLASFKFLLWVLKGVITIALLCLVKQAIMEGVIEEE